MGRTNGYRVGVDAWRTVLFATLALLCAAIGTVARAALPPRSEEEVRRLLTLLAAVGEEYREGVKDGTVIRPIEFDEAKTFLDDAHTRFRDVAAQLGATPDLNGTFQEIGAAIDAHAAADAVATKLAALRQQVVQVTGVAEQVYPPAAPSAERGRQLFFESCVSCHGERGDGKGPSASGLKPPPANFTDAQFMRGETPYDFYHVISLGKTHTGMPAWDAVLSVQQRWDLVSYLWTLAPGSAGIAEGQGIYLAQCASCHGANGNGQGVFSPALVKAAPDLSQAQALARRSDAEIFGSVTEGVAATPMPAFARTLKEDERWKVVAFMRLLSLGGPQTTATEPYNGGPGTSEATGTDGALAESARLLDDALAAYGRGDPQATALAGDAYLQFEPLEPGLGAVDPALKTQIEETFLRLRQHLRVPGRSAEANAMARAIHDDFTAVRAALQPHSSPYALFVESATIILREGFEIVLVIGALLAYVIKAGNASMRRSIYVGTAAGVAMSLATAVAMGELLRLHPSSSDVLEGCTMLLAAVVLFWVSYWLISKTEADKWQRYIRGKVQTALSGRRSAALAGAAFLAVYREGFETVLFYQALYASAPTAAVTLTAGFLAGSIALAVVYVLFRRFQVRIPVQQFFFVTGLFLYAMAAIFAGQGVHELQEAGIVTVTPLLGLPTIPLLGVYPSLESAVLQGIFVVLLLYATAVALRRRQRSGATAADDQGLIGEVRALNSAVEALRRDLATLQSGESRVPGAVQEQVEDVLLQVERLSGQLSGAPIGARPNGRGHRNGH